MVSSFKLLDQELNSFAFSSVNSASQVLALSPRAFLPEKGFTNDKKPTVTSYKLFSLVIFTKTMVIRSLKQTRMGFHMLKRVLS